MQDWDHQQPPPSPLRNVASQEYTWLDSLPDLVDHGAGEFTLGLLPHGRFELLANAPGLFARRRGGRAPAPGGELETTLVLEPETDPGPVIRGVVRSEGVGVPVDVFWQGATRSGAAACARDGTFALEDVEPGPVTVSIRSRHPARCPALELERHVEDSRDAPFVWFHPELPVDRISGRVVYADGTPADGARVLGGYGTCLPGETTTRFDGSFELAVQADVPSQHIEVLPPWAVGVGQRFANLAPGQDEVELVLLAPVVVRWRAVDAASGQVLHGPDLHWARAGERPLHPRSWRPIPDAQGWQAVELSPGTYDLSANHAKSGARPARLEAVAIGPGTAPITFVLEPGMGDDDVEVER